MNKAQIVTGQQNNEKQERARLLRREPTDTETSLWERLRCGQLDGLHFRRQQVIDGFIVDFYCHSAGLVVEVDGSIHKQNPEKDIERDTVLQTRGLTVLHFTNAQIETDMIAVMNEIASFASGQTSEQHAA